MDVGCSTPLVFFASAVMLVFEERVWLNAVDRIALRAYYLSIHDLREQDESTAHISAESLLPLVVIMHRLCSILAGSVTTENGALNLAMGTARYFPRVRCRCAPASRRR
ncbi:hypothetical protein EJ06DRAFT_54595 [Trichodelitschia bisporula]|uniref:Uncharacterized protein n=1 Tax=Trichodelitschia bisporula TaxID=703511 RepID=A0A6G1HUT8_9PEZI|nr:hypothetical protein EJ06DRAFT_54595 [Trichodelitschia bisporula]